MKLGNPLVRIPLRYGIVGGLFASAALTVLYYAGVHPFLVAPFFDFRILLFGLFLFFLLKEARAELGNVLFFFQGLAGTLVFLVAFAIITFTFVLAFAYAESSFLPDFIELFRRQASTFSEDVVGRIGKEGFEKNLESLDRTRPLDLALLYVRQSLAICFFIGIILSVVLRRQNPIHNGKPT